jgi:monovalent cation/hydrogen antiporter
MTSALLIYRIAVGAVASQDFSIAAAAPTLVISVIGSLIAGPLVGWLVVTFITRIAHVPTPILLQFASAFFVWILADRLGLSAILTMVTFAMTLARSAPARTPARVLIPTYAVWETVVFALNILAFIFIGLQLRTILEPLQATERAHYLSIGGVVLFTVIAARFLWIMPINALIRWRHRSVGFHPPWPLLQPSIASGIVVSWAGMRGIVSVAAAMALPDAFPYRDLLVLASFCVVLGTLVLQGLTLKPLMLAGQAPAR